MGCLQAQYAPSMYIGLWSRVEGFRREGLTAALEDRSVVQGTLMRVTIHLVSRADYWPLALAVRDARRALWLRATRHSVPAEELADLRPSCGRRCATAAAPARDRPARRPGPGHRRRPLGGFRPGAALGHMGAPAGRPLCAAEDWLGPPPASLDVESATTPRPAVPPGLRPGHRRRRRRLGRPAPRRRGGGAPAAGPAPVRRRGRPALYDLAVRPSQTRIRRRRCASYPPGTPASWPTPGARA